MQEERNVDAEDRNLRATERPVGIRALATLLGIESLIMLAVTALLAYEVITQPAHSMSTSIALLVMALLAAGALGTLAVGVWRMRSWARGPVTVWQVLQVAAAVVIFQGDIAPWIGWVLAGCSLVGLLLVFSSPVAAALRRDRESDAA